MNCRIKSDKLVNALYNTENLALIVLDFQFQLVCDNLANFITQGNNKKNMRALTDFDTESVVETQLFVANKE